MPFLTLFSASSISAAMAGALASAIWQGSLLALCVAVCLRLLPRLSAAVRSAVWLAVFAIVFALHFIPNPPVAATNAAHFRVSTAWSIGLAAVWLALSLLRAAQFALGAIRLCGILRRALPVALPVQTPAIARRYTVCTSPDVDRPSVLGFWSPRILLPPGLVERLSPAELHQVLLHETEHLRRSDDWTNLLQKLALVLFPLNPVLYWVERRLCLERELACDDRVLLEAGARKAYAECLTRLAEHSLLHRGLALALGAFGRQSELARRVHRILRRPQPSFTPLQSNLAAAALLLGIFGTSVTLAHSPRLIAFTPSAVVAAPRLASETWAPTPADHAKPMLVKAVILSNAAPALHRVAVVRRRAQIAPTNHFRITETRWSLAASLQPRMTLAVSDGHQVQQILVPAVAYAAVRVPNGWIIFQL